MSNLRQFFTGGTGRSGTTILGEMLGHHPDIWMTNPIEIRLLTDTDGLLDLIVRNRPSSFKDLRHLFDRRERTRAFVNKLRDKWWYRIGPDGTPRGLHLGLDPKEFDEAVRRFATLEEARTHSALVKGARQLVSDLLDPPARRAGASMWVDTDPPNARNAHRILRLLPDARVIQVVRDGRDSAASVLKMHWGPKDPMEALEWWRYRMLRAHQGISQAPAKKVMTIRLEDLIVHDRDATYKEIIDFLDITDATTMRAFFDGSMTPENLHPGRWRKEIPTSLVDAFARRYEEIWKELDQRGLTLSPLE